MNHLLAFLLLLSPTIAFAQVAHEPKPDIATIKQLAASGDPNAQAMLGKAYNSGRGVPQDYAEAYFWYDIAAAGELTTAKRENITKRRDEVASHLTKADVSQEQTLALKWFEAHQTPPAPKVPPEPDSADAIAGASNSFASAYWDRKLTSKPKSDPSIQNAAEQGNASAQYNLGLMYASGMGVPQDYAQAGDWLRKAAEQGNADAQYNLGLMYVRGLGVSQDYAQAADWFRKAAEQGDADAERQLGYLYVLGHGVPHDAEQAASWLGKANGADPYKSTGSGSLTLKVLQAESVPYTVESGGGISTNCNISGSANTSGYANTFGNTTFGNATTNSNMRMNCNSYDRTIRWQHVMNTMFVEASDGNAYIIACDRAWRWSKCVPLRAGEKFSARFTEKGVEVEGLNAKGKEVSTTYRILQSRSLR